MIEKITIGMSKIQKQFFCFCFLAYLINLFLQKNNFATPTFFKNYFNDLLCLPIIANIVLQMIRIFHIYKALKFNILQIFVMTLQVSIVFEYLLPIFSKRFVRDWNDVICYAIGAVLFYLFSNR